jgi:hypothetical protein
MGLETATTISGLQSTNPVLSDPVSQGDDHLRLIKSVLKTQFPGAGAAGFNIPITAKETELNFLVGVTSLIQTQLNTHTTNIATAQTTANNALAMIPAGTRMVFAQAAAPSGWTKVTTWANHMLRVVSGTGGGSFTGDSPILNNTVPSHTHGFTSGVESANHTHTFTTSAAADHVHSYNANNSSAQTAQSQGGGITVGVVGANTGAAGAHSHTGTTANDTGSHTHSGTTGANGSAGNWTPSYVDTIICSKN